MNTTTIDLDEPTVEDLSFVRNLIQEFVNETGSVYGQGILDNWQQKHAKIIKVFPKDYKQVLQEAEKQKKAEVTETVKESEEHQNTSRNTLQVCDSII